jgi:hypothetical protein
VAILDACRDDSAERDLKRVASRGGEIIRGLARVKNPEGLILAYATQYLSTAADGDPNGDSPFTTALLNNIATPGLDVKDMFFKVGSEVIASTRGEQRPEISISFYDSYILVPAAIVPAAPPAVSPPPAPPPAAPPLAAPPPITSAPEAKPQSPGGAPPPAGPSAEEIAWGLLKDTKDADQLRRFIQQFPRSPQRAEAEQRVTALDLQAAQPAKPAPMPELERAAMTRSLQLELKRVGCFDGTVDAELGGGTRDALRNFAKFAALSLPQGDPTPDVINKIKGFNKRVCPLVCPAGEKAQGELCMHVEPKARPAPSKPHPAARTDSGHGRCFSFQGRQICE